MKQKNEWWLELFDSIGTGLFGLASRKATNAQVRYLVKKLALRKNMKVLDCPCGIGRISIPLAERGLKVTGIDITQSYLDELEKRATRAGPKIPVECRDMRRITFKNEFDVGLNLWTSFGYFEDEKQNLLTIKKMYEALKPGGRFLLHVINRDWIITNFQARGWDEVGDIISIQSREFDYARSINEIQWRLLKDGKMETYHVSMRMYSYHELVAMFKKVGFVDIEGYGSIKEEPISRDHMMMWVFGAKPGQARRY